MATSVPASDTVAPSAAQEAAQVPFAPSWVDRLTGWVRNLPVPYWIVYLIPALLIFVLATVIRWYDGSYAAAYEAGNKQGLYRVGPLYLYPFHAVPGLVALYVLALIHYLDDVARRALTTFRAAMRVDDAQFRALEYQLTRMPSRPTLLASMVGALFAVLSLSCVTLFFPELAARLLLFTSPVATVLVWVIYTFLWWNWGALTYHTIRQLKLVSNIYSRYTQVDLFNLDPLYAFSWLTARTSIGWVLATYAFILTAPGLLENVITLAVMAFNLVFAVIAFVWPLVGIHRKLEAAKSDRLYRANQSFEALSSELRARTEQGAFESMSQMKDGMEAVNREREILSDVHTWPWQRETVGGLSTALFLPIIIWLVTRLLERVL